MDQYYYSQQNQQQNQQQNPYTGSTYSAPNPAPMPPKKEKKKPSFFSKLLSALAIGLAFGVCAGLGIYAVTSATGTKIPTSAAVSSTSVDEELAKLQRQINELKSGTSVTADYTVQAAPSDITSAMDVTGVVERVMPSMVSISNLFEETISYWGRRITQENTANGSGIIIGENDEEYLIVTNYHVIENYKELTVSFADNSTAPAFSKGYDSDVDIAVIAVKKSDLSVDTLSQICVAKMGDSENLRIGEPAIAIGNSLGYGQSVTTGVISALNREMDMENTNAHLIQTSAAINPGNSGGALLNMQGQVVGINSNKIGGSSVEGMGYAIPISEVKDIIGMLSARATKETLDENQRGYLGIAGATVDTSTQNFGIPAGVYVTTVYEDGAAAAAGIIVSDVITKVDGQTVSEITELQNVLATYASGESVTLTVMRAGVSGYEEKEIVAVLGTKATIEH